MLYKFHSKREKIQPIVLNRIGADVFISRFERLKESEYIEKVSPYLQVIVSLFIYLFIFEIILSIYICIILIVY